MKLSKDIKEFVDGTLCSDYVTYRLTDFSVKVKNLEEQLEEKENDRMILEQAVYNYDKKLKELEEQLKNKQSTDSSIVRLMNNKYWGEK